MESNNGNYIPENLEDGTSLTGEEELKRKSEKSVKEPDKKKIPENSERRISVTLGGGSGQAGGRLS